jgi:uncharacterized protein YkwD
MWNYVDLIIIVAVLLFALSGYFKGFIRQTADFLTLVISIFLSVRFYATISGFIGNRLSVSPNFAKIIAFMILVIIIQFILNIIIHFVYPLVPEKIRRSILNKGFGAIPGLFWGMLFVSILLTIFVAFPLQTKYKDAILGSKTGPVIIQKSSGVEKYIGNIFGGAINDTLTFMTVKPNSGETVDLGFKTTKVSVDEVSENAMLDKVNDERTSRGLKPLVMDDKLRDLARNHSRDMFARGYFAHNNPDGKDPFMRMSELGIVFTIAGENLALAPNVDLAHDGLMNSPGHRANILTAEFGKVGIGCIDGGQYGKMFSQEFTD